MMRHGLILIILVLLLVVFAPLDFKSRATTGDPQQALKEWVAKDHDLSAALQASEGGDHWPLAIWLNRTDRDSRETFALLMHRQIVLDIGVDADGDQRFDDRPLYRWRHRMMAFQDVVTGKRDLDLMLDNHLAYGLVAGTAEPTPTDVQVAQNILPRLLKHVATKPDDHAVHDTIGCVQFVLGDFPKAVASFEAVRKGFDAEQGRGSAQWLTSEKDRRQETKIRTHLQALYTSRLEAARANAARVAAGTPATDPGLLPLPRDLGQPRPEPSSPSTPPPMEAEGKAP